MQAIVTDHDGTAGTPKHAERIENEPTHRREDGSGRVSGETGTGSHDHSPSHEHGTVVSHNRLRAEEANVFDKGRTEQPHPHIDEQDVERIPSMKNSMQRDAGDNAM